MSGKCFCPSRTPKRVGNYEGLGTPLPFRAVCFATRRRGTRHWRRWHFLREADPSRRAIDPGLGGVPRRRVFGLSPLRAGMRTDRIARSNMTMGQGAHHWGASLAPATDQSLSAGASCASSLLAGAGVVTTRLAQWYCRTYARRIAAEAITAGATTSCRGCATGHMSDAGAHRAEPGCLGCGARFHTRLRAKPDCNRSARDLDCGRRAADAGWFDAIRT